MPPEAEAEPEAGAANPQGLAPATSGASAVSRRRGGQPGNMNALVHGFYSRRFRDMESQDLTATLENGLENEINGLRVLARRIFEQADMVEDGGELAALVGVFGMTVSRLGNLMRLQQMLGGGDKMTDTINLVLKELAEELAQYE